MIIEYKKCANEEGTVYNYLLRYVKKLNTVLYIVFRKILPETRPRAIIAVRAGAENILAVLYPRVSTLVGTQKMFRRRWLLYIVLSSWEKRRQ